MKRYSMRALRINAIFQPIVYLLSAVVIALLLYVGGEQVLLKTIQFGTLAMFINYAQLFFDPLKQIARVLAEIQMAQASAERVVALLEEEIEITDYPDVIERYGTLLKEPEYCFTMYYDDEYREQDVDAEICEAVTEMKADRGDLKFRELPAVELAACVMHKGAYRTLPLAYRAIVSFIEDNGYEMIGHQREAYIDGIWNKDSEDDWLTEIQFPVRKIQRT